MGVFGWEFVDGSFLDGSLLMGVFGWEFVDGSFWMGGGGGLGTYLVGVCLLVALSAVMASRSRLC